MEKKSSALRILVVDDEPLMRWSLAQTLLDCGYEVSEAGDGQTALQLLNDAAPVPIDVVVLDCRLPDSNDLRLLSTIRRISSRSQVILMTASGTPEVVSDAQQLGAYCVVHKPFEMNDLAALVQHVGCMSASTLLGAGAQALDASTLAAFVSQEAAPASLEERPRELEANLTRRALKVSNGTNSHAAELLQIKRSTPGDRINRCGVGGSDPIGVTDEPQATAG